MTTMTPEGAIKAAASVARDVADGKLSSSDLQAQAVAECRELFGTVVGAGDGLWSLHADVARQAVSLGALSADELSEWAAVMRHKAGEAVKPPEPHDDPLPAVPLASVAQSHAESPDDDEPEPDAAALQGTSIVSALAVLASTAQQAHAEPAPQRRADSGDYDPLRGFNPGATRRR
ncbi:flagellar hook-length control protein [Mycobacterium intracellulare]|uniref:flagellar hook-length control protein n=1 Tax=Mycobacterium intracellulare TaxID=1767 RepID=UPI00191651FF|nr:flagellar hook-length control protein [Mycobacterium intracellulare]MCA2359587.1 flagellar hook-length control protein [Mycobacterium intracellulare]MCA2369463.1 flagellar hook-length control protein [Mycobacterium intracellulare]